MFSLFKRVFGKHLMAPKWEDIVHEMRLKVARTTSGETNR